MFDEKECVACKSLFLTSALKEDGRCATCTKDEKFAGDAETQEMIKSDKEREERVRAIVREVLQDETGRAAIREVINDMKEEENIDKNSKSFESKACKKCGAMFVPVSAANTKCSDCR